MNQMEIELQVNGLVNPFECVYVLVLQRKDYPFLVGIRIDCDSAIILDRIIEMGSSTKRPRAHKLIKNIAVALGAKIEKVVLTELKEGTFYALIHLQNDKGQTVVLDSRPFDAVALSLISSCPIFAKEQVLKAVDELSKKETRNVLDNIPEDIMTFVEPPTKYKM